MSYSLFLDDFRMPFDAFNYTHDPIYNDEIWVIVRNYKDFVYCIENEGIPDIVSFDHDLADIHYDAQDHLDQDYYDLCAAQNEKTGYHCARWMINYCLDHNLDIPRINLIHSMNTVGAQNIQSLFDTYNKLYPDGTD